LANAARVRRSVIRSREADGIVYWKMRKNPGKNRICARRYLQNCERSINVQMEEKKNILTYEGLKRYEDELHELKVVKRQEVAQKIKEAREQGDLSENAEYDAAKDEQRDIEARIEELEKILKNAEVVVEDEVDLDKINIGCKVKILDLEYNEELEYKIVGSTEANSLKGKISNESPVGKALIGARVDDVVSVETQVGVLQYKVLEIQRSGS
jgi:transcription elongation factor GreA